MRCFFGAPVSTTTVCGLDKSDLLGAMAAVFSGSAPWFLALGE